MDSLRAPHRIDRMPRQPKMQLFCYLHVYIRIAYASHWNIFEHTFEPFVRCRGTKNLPWTLSCAVRLPRRMSLLPVVTIWYDVLLRCMATCCETLYVKWNFFCNEQCDLRETYGGLENGAFCLISRAIDDVPKLRLLEYIFSRNPKILLRIWKQSSSLNQSKRVNAGTGF